ncbi:MAG: AAA family ATPase [Desulfobacterales bacterium]|nr:AAA family ATPase [Desulfobacterales bacterium]
MAPSFEIPIEDLFRKCDRRQFDFKDTSALDPLETVIGQERAVQAIDFGLNMKSAGYNIFVTGPVGTGKTTIVGEIVGQHAQREQRPPDWILVNNFSDAYRPVAIAVPSGCAHDFSRRMRKLVDELRQALPKAFSDKDFQERQAALQKQFTQSQETIFEALARKAAARALRINRTKIGYQTIALKNDQPITQEDFENLPEEEQRQLKENIRSFQEEIEAAETQSNQLAQEQQTQIEALMQEVALFLIRSRLNVIRKIFEGWPAIKAYLDAVQTDMLENVQYFLPSREEGGGEDGANHQGGFDFKRYSVNVLTDRRRVQGAPVIFEPNPTYQNVFGHIEKRAYLGTLKTDFTMVQAGSLLHANGGYLLMEVEAVMMNPMVWEALKRALQTKLLSIEDMASEMGYGVTSQRPEPIPLDVKVILLGSYTVFEQLQNFDSKFDKIFKVRADFDNEVDLTPETIQLYARFIGRVAREEKLLPFAPDGVAAMVEYGQRFAANQQKLSLRFGPIVGVLKEADYWARRTEAQAVVGAHIHQALQKRRFRYNLYEEKMAAAFEDGNVLLDVDDRVVGQVNALAVYQMGDIAFGRPSRITAETFMGEPHLVSIEREAELSGRTHSKGVMILSGYLGRTFAQHHPLGLSISIAFEQSYGPVDGDSASSTELYAILSSLADLPIHQGIAVTGSVNQKGEVQAIGGVNQKIEGYFDVCRKRGLSGRQGVLIPRANVKNLMLKKQVVDAVAAGQFHLYQVARVTEGIEILTGVEAGQADAEGRFPDDSVYGRVQHKLKTFVERSRRLKQGAGQHAD